MIRSACAIVLATTLAALPLAAPPKATGCAAVPPLGKQVEIADEAALIVWDEATKTEHFIRRANFRGTTADFGFLVPTPTKPDIGEASDGVFDSLATATAPKVVEQVVRRPRPRRQGHGDAMMAAGGAAQLPMSGVQVLEQSQVAGLDYVVLRFRRGGKDDDPAAGAAELADWLKKHGYEFGPALVAWLKPYVANDWVMTAFRIAGGDGGSGRPPAPSAATNHGVRGKPVRMSFQTERPFYPYREPTPPKADPQKPKDQPGETQRFLRVYFLAEKKYEGKLGGGPAAWPGRIAWSDKLTADQTKAGVGLAKLPGGAPAGAIWLTEFEDYSSPRPATDEVYYGPDPDQTPVARPPIVREIVEWYDEPEPEKEILSETGRIVIFVALIGVGAVALLLRLAFGMTGRK